MNFSDLSNLKSRNDLGAFLSQHNLLGEGVEVGVFRGEFSKRVLDTWPGRLTGVDVYNRGTEFEILAEAIFRNEIHVKDGRYRIIVNTSMEGAGLVPDELSWVYIDADHTNPGITDDINRWWPKVKRGGLFGGHDFGIEGDVRDAVLSFLGRHEGIELHIADCSSWFTIKP